MGESVNAAAAGPNAGGAGAPTGAADADADADVAANGGAGESDAMRRAWPESSGDLSDEQLLASLDTGGAPTLRVNFVSSIDGAATHHGLSGGLSGAADKRLFELQRRLCDVVLVGAGTVRAEGYGPMRVSEESARWRAARGRPEHPVFAIVSGSLDLDPTSDIFTKAPVRPIVVTTSSVPAERRAAFADVADIVIAGETSLDVPPLLAALAERGLHQVLCEGGPSLFGTLLAADAVDELCLTVSPVLEAGTAPRISHGPLEAARERTLAQVLVAGSTLLLRYTR